MQKFVDEEMKNMTVLNERLSLASALHDSKAAELDMLADAIIDSMEEKNRYVRRTSGRSHFPNQAEVAAPLSVCPPAFSAMRFS